MSFDGEKTKIGRERIDVVEIDLDSCSLTHGSSPCTATETGDAKCFNTLETCNDLANYASTTKTYKFCTNRSPHPIGLDAIPSLTSVSTSPSKIDITGGLGVRASVSLNFNDHPSSDIDIDDYLTDRTYDAFERATFWTKLRARNPNYQFRELRLLSGYLVDGEYIAANFLTRTYLIESLNASNGRCSITAKDPLKLAGKNKSQAPAPSTGLLNAAINDSVTSLTLTPSGIGNDEYPASGWVCIKSEVMSFTRSADVLTIVRAQYNTVAISHSANDTVQLCLEYSGATRGALDFIVDDLLVNFAGVSSSFIPTASWSAEVSTYLSGLLDTIITKPHDVNKLLKELTASMPHYLSWDEYNSQIDLTALKAPPTSAAVLDMDGYLVKDKTSNKDLIDMRKSTIFVNFGQFDPTKKLDEFSNYQQTHARIDTDSIAKYSSSAVETINSRWISNTNKAAALQLAALKGRRFSNIPRSIGFTLDAKDSDVRAGQTKSINHRDIVDATGLPVDTVFQIISARESGDYSFEAVEYSYGEALPEDEGGGDPDVDLIIISISDQNINLRTIYNSLFPTPDATTEAKFVVENGVIIGGATLSSTSLDTGSWPSGAIVTLQTNTGSYVIGRGGNGGGVTTPAAEAGSLAIILNHDMTLINNGIIGGGGGGGGYDKDGSADAAGGGGAGNDVGTKGTGTAWGGSGSADVFTSPDDGTTELGGAGGRVVRTSSSPEYIASAGAGGDLGAAGTTAIGTGGAAGDAIDKNGYTLTETTTGDIRGSIIT